MCVCVFGVVVSASCCIFWGMGRKQQTKSPPPPSVRPSTHIHITWTDACLLAFFRSYMRQLGLDRLVDVRHQGRVQAEEVGEQTAAVGGAEVGGLEEALSLDNRGVGVWWASQ